jgi:hypothetical protein
VYHFDMKVAFNPRENGACPLCSRCPECRVRLALRCSLEGLRPARGGEIEIVIYTCPLFKEKP